LNTLFFIANILKRYPKYLAGNVCLLFLSTVFSAGSLFSIGPIVDFMIKQNRESMSPLTTKVLSIIEYFNYPVTQKTLVILFLSLVLLSVIIRVGLKYFMLKMQYKVLHDLVIETFKKCFSATWYFFSRIKTGTLINSFTREMDVVGNAFRSVAELTANSIQSLFYILIPFFISWEITLFSVFLVLLFSGGYMQFGKITYRLGKENTITANRFSSILQEAFSSAKLILGFGNQNHIVGDLDRALIQHQNVTIKSQTISNAIGEFTQPGALLIVVFAFYFSQRIDLPVSETTVLLVSLMKILPMIGRISAQKTALDNFTPSYEQIKVITDQAIQFKQISGKIPFTGLRNNLVLEDVDFFYPDKDFMLKNITIRVPKGKMIALVGASGSGKSTVVDIIMGFNRPTKGKVLIDKLNLDQIDIMTYRQKIGYVPQDSMLFNMSIRENLLWACEDASQEEIKEACRLANAEEFIDKLKRGIDTIVGDRGVRLSGGQVQRIALARAVLRQPEILILDEATSSLDTRSERLIQEALERISGDITVIVVAHRLSTIVNADYIYVLENGEIVEEGVYNKLIEKNGVFHQMAVMQKLININ